MKVNKYLISIQQKGETRYDQFFSHSIFKEEEFKVFGIIGADIPTKDYFNLGVKNKIRPLTPAELGCTLSHLKAIEDFVSSDADYAYIFEDDVQLKSKFNFDQDLSFLGNAFILSLGGVSLHICRNIKGKVVGNFFEKPLLKVDGNFYDCIFYAMGYVIDKKAAQDLLNFHKNIQVIDHWSLFLKKSPCTQYYMCDLLDHPEVAVVTDTTSNIEHERQGHIVADAKPKLLKLLRLYMSYRIFKYKRKILKLFLNSYPRHKN